MRKTTLYFASLVGLEIHTEIDLKYLNFQRKKVSVGFFQMLLFRKVDMRSVLLKKYICHQLQDIETCGRAKQPILKEILEFLNRSKFDSFWPPVSFKKSTCFFFFNF